VERAMLTLDLVEWDILLLIRLQSRLNHIDACVLLKRRITFESIRVRVWRSYAV
jgi:hypothetical protein